MKDLRYVEHGEDYVVLYDYAGTKGSPFLVEAKVSGHRHEDRFSTFSQACAAFNAVVLTIRTTGPETDK